MMNENVGIEIYSVAGFHSMDCELCSQAAFEQVSGTVSPWAQIFYCFMCACFHCAWTTKFHEKVQLLHQQPEINVL